MEAEASMFSGSFHHLFQRLLDKVAFGRFPDLLGMTILCSSTCVGLKGRVLSQCKSSNGLDADHEHIVLAKLGARFRLATKTRQEC